MQLFGGNGGPFYLLPKLPLGKKSTQGSEVGGGLKSTIMNRSGLLPLWADMEKRRSGVLHGLQAPRPDFIIKKKLKENRDGSPSAEFCENPLSTDRFLFLLLPLSQAGAWGRKQNEAEVPSNCVPKQELGTEKVII